MTCDFAVSTGTFQRAAQNSQCRPQLLIEMIVADVAGMNTDL